MSRPEFMVITWPCQPPVPEDLPNLEGLMQPRILRVVTLASRTGKYGGPFDTATRQARIVDDMGFPTTLLAGVLDNDQPTRSSESGLVELIFPKVQRWLPGSGFVGLMSISLIQCMRREIKKADLVHVSASRELIPCLAMAICIILRKPFVAQPHGMLTSRTSLGHQIVDVIVRHLVGRSRGIIALTQVEAEAIATWSRGNSEVTVLGNPVPDGVSARSVPKAPVSEALFVARLHPRKRVIVFADAARIAYERGWNDRYAIVGPDGGDLPLLENALRENPNLRYEGAISAASVTDRVQSTGVFVLPSENEPWGNVLAVAIASGVPAVVSQSAALAGAIADYNAGAVIPDADPAALAEAVHVLLTNGDEYARANSGALKMADEKLSRGQQGNMLRFVYERALAPVD